MGHIKLNGKKGLYSTGHVIVDNTAIKATIGTDNNRTFDGDDKTATLIMPC